MSVLVTLAIFPLDKGEELAAYVAKALRVIERSGLPYSLGSMSTCIEGDYDDVMAVVRGCFLALQDCCDRVYMTVALDYRAGENRMHSKVQAVEQMLHGQHN
jgi:uncharacterized protein (TIGR00106 family)